MREPIRVRVLVSETGSVSPDLWETRLYAKLREAGIPALPDGTVESGELYRFDDPADFGACIYEWRHPKGNE